MEDYYLAGELAQMAGVSARTIRFYDEKGLLKPVDYSEGGYRYYSKDSLKTIQKILVWKSLDLTLDQIRQVMTDSEKCNLRETLLEQKKVLESKVSYYQHIISGINEALSEKEDELEAVKRFFSIYSNDDVVKEQYKTVDNLNRRINIHSYSTSPEDWMKWVFDRMNIQQGDRILELGCGTGLLWTRNFDQLRPDTELFLTDISEQMLQSVRNFFEDNRDELNKKNIKVHFIVADANDLHIDGDFDVIIANHMLYHVERKKQCLDNIRKHLKQGGTFYCSTIGSGHMRQIHELIQEFDSNLIVPLKKVADTFTLQNGGEQLRHYFNKVKLEVQDNDLVVDDATAIWNYVFSFGGNISQTLDSRGESFMSLIEEKLRKQGALYINKETGLFTCK